MTLPSKVRIVEVGPRDGLQNEKNPVSTAIKVELIHRLATAGLNDPRVSYWEPAKWIARLRHLNTSNNLVLLKTNMEAGHGGASGRFEQLKEVALDYAFSLKIAGKA